MKSKNSRPVILFLLLPLILFQNSPVFSSPAINYLEGQTFARPISLGGSFDPVSSDLSALFANPAGLNQSKSGSLGSLFSQPFDDTTIMVLGWGGAAPFDLRYGIGYRNLNVANVVSSPEVANYTDQDLSLVLGREIDPAWSLGASFRTLKRGLSKDIPGYEELSASGYTLDGGVHFHPHPRFSAGLLLQNFSGQLTYADGLVEKFDPNINLGAALAWEEEDFFGIKKNHWLTLFASLNKRESEPLAQFHFGGEWRPQPAFSFRAGLDQSPHNAANNYTNYTFGFGFNAGAIDLDYAYKKMNDLSNRQTHYFSIAYSPQEILILSSSTMSAETEVFPTPESSATLKVKRRSFSDVPENYWAKEEIELLATAGILDGFPDGSFRPETKLTKEDFYSFLIENRAINLIVVPEPQELIRGQQAIEELGLSPYALETPEKPLTRGELAYLYYKTPAGQAAVRRLRDLTP